MDMDNNATLTKIRVPEGVVNGTGGELLCAACMTVHQTLRGAETCCKGVKRNRAVQLAKAQQKHKHLERQVADLERKMERLVNWEI